MDNGALILQRLDAIEGRLEQMDARLKSAFPAGDADGHRRYHELMIQEIEDRRALIKAVREKTIAGLVWALILGLAVAVWSYLRITFARGG